LFWYIASAVQVAMQLAEKPSLRAMPC